MSTPDQHLTTVAVGVTTDRLARVSPAARAVHRQVLTAYAATGNPPGRDTLVDASGGADPDALLRELHDRDVIRLDPEGAVEVAYPFSTRPTPHVVTIAGGPTVYAMCAIDALGMAAMLRRDISIASTDPRNGQPVTVTIHKGRAGWRPGSAVVIEGAITSPVGDCCQPDTSAEAVQPAVDRCCAVLNFFTDPASAAAWLADHREVTGKLLTQTKALRLGAAIFGHLLNA